MQLKINSLLNEVSFNVGTLREAKKRFSDQLAPDFSIFDYFRADEMALSKCFAGLLDPHGSHGQGSLFLRAFFETICPDKTWVKNFDHCKVITEKQANGQRRIDVYLNFSEGAVGIENKPWAGDQDQQLRDYANYLKKSSNGKDWLLLYLCNNESSQKSLLKEEREQLESKGNFIQSNYSQIIQWLIACKVETKALSVRIFIEELIKFIRISINGELEMSEEKETCKTALESKNNLNAAFDISKAMSSVKENLLKNFHDTLKLKLSNNGFHLVWDKTMNNKWTPSSGFGVKFLKNQDLYLRFEFEKADLNKFIWGIRRENTLTNNDANRWGLVAKQMNSQFDESGATEWWPWYSNSSNELLDKEVHNWGDVDFLWEEMIRKEGDHLAQKITDITSRVHNAFSDNLFLLTK
jgi:hypothetical protein